MQRTVTSIALLTVLLIGIFAPTGLCVLLCGRHSRPESQRHCIQSSDTMPGMAHDHSAKNHAAVQAMSPVMVSDWCVSHCVTAERLNASRKFVPHVTVVKSGPVVSDTAAEFATANPTAAWSPNNSPPYPSSASAASFSILRN
jgi:hypothetical protein